MNLILKISFLILFGISLLYAVPNEGLLIIISGENTSDGGSLFCQNFSSENPNIKLKHFKGIKYDFAGLIHSNDSTRVWMGQNSAGFSVGGTKTSSDSLDKVSEGHIIKLALGKCARVEDFAHLLFNIQSSISANFGCMDKYGNAAIFEYSPNNVIKLDVNNPIEAKLGFLVRSNFAFSQNNSQGIGVVRYHRAVELIKAGIVQNKLNSKYLFQHILKDIKTEKGNPRENAGDARLSDELQIFETDQSINQFNTVAGAVFSSPEKSNQYTLLPFWCALGQPLCSVFFPVWTKCSSLPEDLAEGVQPDANFISIETQSELYTSRTNPKLLDFNAGQKGKNSIFNLINNIENDIFQKVENQINFWSESTEPTLDNICQFQHKIISDAIRQIR